MNHMLEKKKETYTSLNGSHTNERRRKPAHPLMNHMLTKEEGNLHILE